MSTFEDPLLACTHRIEELKASKLQEMKDVEALENERQGIFCAIGIIQMKLSEHSDIVARKITERMAFDKAIAELESALKHIESMKTELEEKHKALLSDAPDLQGIMQAAKERATQQLKNEE